MAAYNATTNVSVINYHATTTSVTSLSTSSCDTSLTADVSRQAYLYGMGVVVAVAMVTNSVQLMVYSGKSLHPSAFRTYMAALAVSDSLAAFLFLPRHWLRLLLRHIGWPDVTPYDGSVHACLTLTYAARTCQFISAWLLVAMTTERLVATLQPVNWRSPSRQPVSAKQTIAMVTIIGLLANSYILFTWDSVVVPPSPDDVHTDLTTREAAAVGGPNVTLTRTLTRYDHFQVVVGEPLCTAPPVDVASISSVAVASLSVGLADVIPVLVAGVVSVAILRLAPNWQVRARRMTSSTMARLAHERRTSRAVATVGLTCGLLGLPYACLAVVSLCEQLLTDVLLRQPNTCLRVTLAYASDIGEVIAAMGYTVKCVLCAVILSTRLPSLPPPVTQHLSKADSKTSNCTSVSKLS